MKKPKETLKNSLVAFTALVVCVAMFAPFLTSAQGGLVPCGGTGAGQEFCTVCDIFKLTNNVLKFGFNVIVLPLVTLAILIGGIMMLTAGGSEDRVKRGKSILFNSILGLVVSLLAYIAVSTILAHIAGDAPALWNPITHAFPLCKW